MKTFGKKGGGFFAGPSQQQQNDKMANYKKLAVVGDDVMYVDAEMAFYCHGKHPTLAGIESVVVLKLSDLIAMFAPVFAGVLLPLSVAAEKQLGEKAKEAASKLILE